MKDRPRENSLSFKLVELKSGMTKDNPEIIGKHSSITKVKKITELLDGKLILY